MGAGQLGFGEEVTYGTAVVPTAFAEIMDEQLQTEHQHASPPVFRSYSKRVIDSLFSDNKGSLKWLSNLNGPEAMVLKHLLGGLTLSGVGPYTRTYPPTAGLPAVDRIGLGLTIEILRASGLCWRYAGCKIQKYRHDMPLGDFATITADVIGKSEALAGPATATYATLAQQKPVQYTAKFDGGSALPVRSGFVELENPTDEPSGWGSATFVVEPDRNGDLIARAEIEVYFQNTTEYAKFASQADVDVEIKVTQGANSITYNLDKCKLLQATPHKSGRERLFGRFQVESQYSSAALENCQIVLVNDNATPITYP